MMTRNFVRLVITAGLLLLWTWKTLAHGTGYRQPGFRAVALEFVYSTGETMSYREARVFSPEDDKFAYQSGRTDGKGRFAFVPDVPGLWRVLVRDEEGHQCTAEIVISDEWSAASESESQGNSTILDGWELFLRALLGVSLIFNAAMIIRRKHAH